MPPIKFFLAVVLVFPVTFVSACQDKDEQSSRREAEQIKSVEEAGGRVYRISAADTSREVSFNLSDKPVGDDQLKGLNTISEVIWLNLAGTNITNDGLKHLNGMPLKKLHLERTKIGDDGLKHLKAFKDLVYLNLYDTKVTDAGIEHLKGLKNLKKVYVWKSGITDDGIKKLQGMLPNAEVVGALKLDPVVIEEPKKEEPKKDDKKKAEPAKKESPKKKEGKKEPAKKGKGKKKSAKKKDN